MRHKEGNVNVAGEIRELEIPSGSKKQTKLVEMVYPFHFRLNFVAALIQRSKINIILN